MRSVLICTVGTSLKSNLERATDKPLATLLDSNNIKALSLELSNLAPEDRMLGAEINSVAGIVNKGMLAERIYLYLLVSDTLDGIKIGDLLKAYFSRHLNTLAFEHVEKQVIEDLTDKSAERFRRQGLRNLVKAIAEIVRRHGTDCVLINATGGYKAQISFAGMIGQALEIPVCYLFEKFSEVIELPPQPIAMDMNLWLSNASFFYELEGDGVVENPVKREPRLASLVEEVVPGCGTWTLSATGQLFHETFAEQFRRQRQSLLPPACAIPPEKKVIRYEDGNAGKHKGLAGYLRKLCQRSYVERIYTHYFNPRLSQRNLFRISAKGDVSQIEGVYSDGQATTKFDVVTTAKDEMQRNAVLADLFWFLTN
jgi:putative CRISPR-associated protein (TIGR02619 family)